MAGRLTERGLLQDAADAVASSKALSAIGAAADQQKDLHDDVQKEWAACRDVVGRLDGTLTDLRKYGFGLVTGLITAGSFIGGKLTDIGTSGKAEIVAVISAFVVVLFIVDRYYSMLQWGALRRAEELEAGWLPYRLTWRISDFARH